MTLRAKIVLLLAALAASATAAIGVVTYRTTSRELVDTVDRSLETAASRIVRMPDSSYDPDGDGVADGPGDRDGDGDGGGGGGGGGDNGRPRRGGDDGGAFFEQIRWQVIDADGTILLSSSADVVDVGDIDRRVAIDADDDALRTVEVATGDGVERLRVLTVPFLGGALMMSRSLAEQDAIVSSILQRTLLAVVVVIAVTLLAGWLIARQVTRRLEHLTATAGTVADTGRLDVHVPVDGADETGQLGRAFSRMLDALQRSKNSQQQLVQDAGHELRTPLTSLRTNVSVLRRNFGSLTAEQREQLLADLDSETRELTDLVNELVQLATDQRDDEPIQFVQLSDIAERAAARARRRTTREIFVITDDSSLHGQPAAIERAVQNLVDNACKFAPTGAIEVTVRGGVVSVRDHGPGLDPADIPQLFDRFYRAVGTRSLPGSGLGLSIVKSVADAHGGSVFARNAVDGAGGAEVGIVLPSTPPGHDTAPVSDGTPQQ